jgi:hypothetical protein
MEVEVGLLLSGVHNHFVLVKVVEHSDILHRAVRKQLRIDSTTTLVTTDR